MLEYNENVFSFFFTFWFLYSGNDKYATIISFCHGYLYFPVELNTLLT